MQNIIKWTKKAVKQLNKIQDKKRIYVATQDLLNMPNVANIKALVNHKYQYRLRVGSYRVFFNFDGNIHIVQIEEVKKRDERTY